jgi:hypothetical protein
MVVWSDLSDFVLTDSWFGAPTWLSVGMSVSSRQKTQIPAARAASASLNWRVIADVVYVKNRIPIMGGLIV